MMGEIEIVYQDRILKITKCLTEEDKNKYKIEITDGRFCRFLEGYFINDEQAMEGAQRGFRKFYNKREKGGTLKWVIKRSKKLNLRLVKR